MKWIPLLNFWLSLLQVQVAAVVLEVHERHVLEEQECVMYFPRTGASTSTTEAQVLVEKHQKVTEQVY